MARRWNRRRRHYYRYVHQRNIFQKQHQIYITLTLQTSLNLIFGTMEFLPPFWWHNDGGRQQTGRDVVTICVLCVCTIFFFSSRSFGCSLVAVLRAGVILPHAQDCLGTEATRKDFDTNILYCNICMPYTTANNTAWVFAVSEPPLICSPSALPPDPCLPLSILTKNQTKWYKQLCRLFSSRGCFSDHAHTRHLVFMYMPLLMNGPLHYVSYYMRMGIPPSFCSRLK